MLEGRGGEKTRRRRDRTEGMMHQKRELCRNFQRGSCRFGEGCKFLHGIGNQQQYQQQQQQSKPNPLFGTLKNSQPTPNQQQQNRFKPFENKWTRSSSDIKHNQPPAAAAAAAAANHSCTDPNSCKQQIAEDFKHERPLWNLTCYAHWKYFPCDISGDISYEELRASAYDDAKRGLTLASIVERERNLLNSKLVEFENLLRNPYVVSPSNLPSGQRPSFGNSLNPSHVPSQKNVPPSVSSFTQLGISTNQGFNTSGICSSLASPNISFGQQSPHVSSQISGLFGQQSMQSPVGAFGKLPMAIGSVESSLQFPSGASIQSNIFSNDQNVATNLVGHASTNNQIAGVQKDASIWLKDSWNVGEIPEDAPPDEFV